MLLVSGVDVVPLLLFGVELEVGFEVLFGLDEFMSVELELLLGLVLVLELEFGLVALPVEADPLAPVVEFASEPVVFEGEVVEDGELEVPLCVEELDGELWLWALLAPLPAPLPSLLPIVPLWAIASPVEKSTAVAIVKSFLVIRNISPER